MADAGKLGLDILCRHHVTIGEMAEIELDAGLEAPLQRDLVDRDRPLAPIHGRGEVIGRVEMGTVMRDQLDLFDRPGLAIGQIALSQPGKEAEQARDRLIMVDIGDLGAKAFGVGNHIVFKENREVDDLSRHGFFP